jgi:hypothetical protein
MTDPVEPGCGSSAARFSGAVVAARVEPDLKAERPHRRRGRGTQSGLQRGLAAAENDPVQQTAPASKPCHYISPGDGAVTATRAG